MVLGDAVSTLEVFVHVWILNKPIEMTTLNMIFHVVGVKLPIILLKCETCPSSLHNFDIVSSPIALINHPQRPTIMDKSVHPF